MKESASGSSKAARLVSAGEGRILIEGALDFTTVSALATETERLFQPRGQLRIDLSGVDRVNSAGLALLLEWMDIARARGVDLQILNLPESLARIAAFSNLGSLLPVARQAS